MKIVIPIKADDMQVVLKNLEHYQRFLQFDNLIVVTSGKLEEAVEKYKNIKIIDEDTLIEGLTFVALKKYLDQLGAIGRTGWYFQQFLKLGYALKTEDEYYMIWDADTVPIKPIEIFDEKGQPFFDIKTEYHKPYFETMKRLLNIEKTIDGSFISEHMLFKTSFVREMIDEIQMINPSQPWFFNVIDAIDKEDLPFSGFSEYETYGTYVVNKHPGFYNLREFDSVRCGKKIFGELPREEVCRWLSNEYSTISFENSQDYLYRFKGYNNEDFRNKVRPHVFVPRAEKIADTIGIPVYFVKKVLRKTKKLFKHSN